MSQASIINWQASSANKATIASVQSLSAAGGALQLNTSYLPNNTLAFPNNTNPNGPFIYDQVARSISLTSGTTDNSGVIFTVTGLGSAVDGNGNPTGLLNQLITEDITGPAANATTYSVKIYTQIISIVTTTATAVTNLSVGFGIFGITNFIFPDDNRFGWYASCSAQVFNRTTLEYSGYISLNKPSYPGTQGNLLPFVGGEIPAFPIVTAMTDASTNQIAQLDFPVATLWFSVSANAIVNANESAIFTFVQQGIR